MHIHKEELRLSMTYIIHLYHSTRTYINVYTYVYICIYTQRKCARRGRILCICIYTYHMHIHIRTHTHIHICIYTQKECARRWHMICMCIYIKHEHPHKCAHVYISVYLFTCDIHSRLQAIWGKSTDCCRKSTHTRTHTPKHPQIHTHTPTKEICLARTHMYTFICVYKQHTCITCMYTHTYTH